MSKGDNTREIVKHSEVQHQFIISESDHILYQPQPKILNVGGVKLKKVEFIIGFELSPQLISNALISTIYSNINNALILSDELCKLFNCNPNDVQLLTQPILFI